MMRINLTNVISKPAGRIGSSFLLLVCLASMMTGCVPAPTSQIPIAEIAVTKGHLLVQNHTGHVWFNARITIDDKYTYKADVLPAVKSSLPLSDFVDDRGHGYEPGRLSVRKVTIDVADTMGNIRHFHW
ncbi:hypothetical protein [Paenibacillus sacheonensis]|uniref:Uncharacterized protein n=1 Tax=Paenibacillus sacheonensis TaxID=742054 RepID=A0A7X4YU52_9BACL|nr:hypothetical protein [Paenibacillus sacheonensis]MBM7566979.1 hypothetical protein [Paenibacillus sacheonensis]NBC71601.1 hypothetical protein [Paenibacillus sacheonensis]